MVRVWLVRLLRAEAPRSSSGGLEPPRGWDSPPALGPGRPKGPWDPLGGPWRGLNRAYLGPIWGPWRGALGGALGGPIWGLNRALLGAYLGPIWGLFGGGSGTPPGGAPWDPPFGAYLGPKCTLSKACLNPGPPPRGPF